MTSHTGFSTGTGPDTAAPASATPRLGRVGGHRHDSEQPHEQPRVAPHSRHITAIDGLRALAILGVVAYHTRPSLLNGGFLGVTVFFVISGFLITRSVDAGLERTGTLAYGGYVIKRLRRLVPPTIVIIACVALAAYLVSPSLLPKAQADALPSALFVGNWVSIFRHVSYFAAAGLPSPLTHLWFLAVLMQFYLLWPPMLLLMHRARMPRPARATVVAALTLASTVAMAILFDPTATGSRAYYGLDTRAAELLAGALLALVLPAADRPQRAATTARRRSRAPEARASAARSRIGDAVGFALIAALVVAFVLVRASFTGMYRGGYLVTALLTALLLAVVMVPGNMAGRLLSLRPLRYIGSRSFSLYLVHYPMLEMMNPATRTTKLAWWEWIVQALAIWAATEVFYQLVERSIRVGGTSGADTRDGGNNVGNGDGAGNGAAPARSRHRAAPRRDRRMMVLRGLRIVRRVIVVVCAVAVTLLCVLPLDWSAIAQARSAQLRPVTAAVESEATRGRTQSKRTTQSTRQGTAQSGDGSNGSAGSNGSNAGKLVPVAEKVPANLDAAGWTYDAGTGVCSADPLIISDSVEMGAQRVLVHTMPNAIQDNQIGRSLTAFAATYQQHVAAGDDKRVVVAALGSNDAGTGSEQEFENAVNAVNGKPLYFITIRNPAMNQDSINAAMRAVAAKHKNVGIMDWYGLSEGHSEYFYDDGVHLTIGDGLGRDAYSHMIIQAMCGQ
ncbi:acyltransferase family protein [Bifidobacterium stellenboschense]|nr:acyltransferase family protein [Bifidobacterium stellenboschense]